MMTADEFLPGDVLVLNDRRGGWFSSTQRLVTGMPFTHSAVFVGDVLGIPSVFEAREVATFYPVANYLGNPNVDYVVYRPVLAWAGEKGEALRGTYTRFAASIYGYFQLVWFLWRRFWEIFGVDMRNKKNHFPLGDICSEIVYRYLWALPQTSETNAILSEWNDNTVHSGDINVICRRLPTMVKIGESYR